MGLNDDRLSDREHREMRDTVLAGTQRIRPAGAHRAQLIAGAAALVLVGGICGGAITTAALWNSATETPPISSSTPTPTPTAEPTTAPAPAPTSTPTTSPLVADGDCSALLTEDEVVAISGADAVPEDRFPVADPATIGGISCAWGANDGEDWWIELVAYPAAAIPAGVRAMTGVMPECGGGDQCAYAEFFDGVWVHAVGIRAEDVRRAVDLVGPRAAINPGRLTALPPSAWTVPQCESLRSVISEHLGRSDLQPYAGDAHPTGMPWDVLVEHGAASWCTSLGEGIGSYSEYLELYIAPGSTVASREYGTNAAAVAIEIPQAERAWLSPTTAPDVTRIVAITKENTIIVGSRFLDHQVLEDLTGLLVAYLNAGGK